MPILPVHLEPPKNKPFKYTKATIPASIAAAISAGKGKKALENPTMQAVATKLENSKNAPRVQNGNTSYPLGPLATSCNAGKKDAAKTAAKTARSLKPWSRTYTTLCRPLAKLTATALTFASAIGMASLTNMAAAR